MPKQNNLTDIWNIYSDTIIKEGKSTRPIEGGNKKMGTKPGPGAVDLNSKDAKKIQHTGNVGTTEPVYEIEGMEKPIDPKHKKGKKKGKEKNLYEPEKYSSEKFDEKVEKGYKESININMKSVFDKLFEEVMDGQESNEELDALGIEAGDEGAGEDSDEITITLDKDMAKQLCDILQAAMGDESDDADEAEDMEHEDYEEMEEAEEEGEDDEDEEVEEAVEADDLGHALVNAKDTGLKNPKNNKVTKVGAGKVSSKKGDSKLKGQTGDEDGSNKGHDLVNTGNNKVGSGSVASLGASLFD